MRVLQTTTIRVLTDRTIRAYQPTQQDVESALWDAIYSNQDRDLAGWGIVAIGDTGLDTMDCGHAPNVVAHNLDGTASCGTCYVESY